jgi:hypothetical protein
MELSALSENIVTVPYKHGDDTLELRVNIDAFTPEFWRLMKSCVEEKFKMLELEIEKALRESSKVGVKGQRKPRKLTKAQQVAEAEREFKAEVKAQLDGIEGRAKQLEVERETNIEFLIPHVLKGWDVVENGSLVALTAEVLNTLPPRLIQDLFDTCVKAAKTVKKREDEDEETSGDAQRGSSGLRAVGGSGLSG